MSPTPPARASRSRNADVRPIPVAGLREAVGRLLVESNYTIPSDVLDALGCHSMRRATAEL